MAGEEPVDEGHGGHLLLRLHPVDLPEVKEHPDDDVGAVGDGQGVDLVIVGPVHDLLELGPDHGVKGVLQVLVGLRQRPLGVGADPHGQHTGGQDQLVGHVAAQLADDLPAGGTPPGGLPVPVVVHILQRRKGFALQRAVADAHETVTSFPCFLMEPPRRTGPFRPVPAFAGAENVDC